MDVDWTAIAKIYGPLGVFAVVTILLVWKKLLPYIERQHKEHIAALQATIEDAREERDIARKLRERETQKFIDSLRIRDEKMERGFSELIVAIHRIERDNQTRQ